MCSLCSYIDHLIGLVGWLEDVFFRRHKVLVATKMVANIADSRSDFTLGALWYGSAVYAILIRQF